MNFGLNIIFIPLGFLLAPRPAKKVFLAFLSLFIIGNLFKFSSEVAANHKFFNLFIIIANIYTANFLVFLLKKAFCFAPFLILAIFVLTRSGAIEFFPIKNDYFYQISDAPKNPEVAWIIKNTKPKSLFLNSSFLYHPASLAGRNIYLGWLYFAWSIGYDTAGRAAVMNNIYRGGNKGEVCHLLTTNRIDYFTVENVVNDPIISNVNVEFFKANFIESFSNPQRLFLIYDVKLNCSSLL